MGLKRVLSATLTFLPRRTRRQVEAVALVIVMLADVDAHLSRQHAAIAPDNVVSVLWRKRQVRDAERAVAGR